jgi:hypothetical protein
MDWTAAVDAYCERVGPEFWAEPVNALTNAAFLVAAFWALRHWRRQPNGDGASLALIAVVALVGIGSFLFHTIATRWAALADVVPIAVFIHLYFFFAMRRILGLRPWCSAALTLGFFIAGLALGPQFGRLFGSSGGYAPAALAIFAVALAIRTPGNWRSRRPSRSATSATWRWPIPRASPRPVWRSPTTRRLPPITPRAAISSA